MNQSIRLRLIEWGVSAEHTPLEKIVRKAIDIETSEEAYRWELRNARPGQRIESGDGSPTEQLAHKRGDHSMRNRVAQAMVLSRKRSGQTRCHCNRPVRSGLMVRKGTIGGAVESSLARSENSYEQMGNVSSVKKLDIPNKIALSCTHYGGRLRTRPQLTGHAGSVCRRSRNPLKSGSIASCLTR